MTPLSAWKLKPEIRDSFLMTDFFPYQQPQSSSPIDSISQVSHRSVHSPHFHSSIHSLIHKYLLNPSYLQGTVLDAGVTVANEYNRPSWNNALPRKGDI